MNNKEIYKFLYNHKFKESAIRELFSDPLFLDPKESWKFVMYIHIYTKLSFDFIRELRQLTWINWNSFINDTKGNYTQEEKDRMIKHFKLVKTPAFNGNFNWSED